MSRTFLSTEARFQLFKAYEERNLIVPVVGNFGGRTALRAIGDDLRARGLSVRAFYLSNVEQYLFGGAIGTGPWAGVLPECRDAAAEPGQCVHPVDTGASAVRFRGVHADPSRFGTARKPPFRSARSRRRSARFGIDRSTATRRFARSAERSTPAVRRMSSGCSNRTARVRRCLSRRAIRCRSAARSNAPPTRGLRAQAARSDRPGNAPWRWRCWRPRATRQKAKNTSGSTTSRSSSGSAIGCGTARPRSSSGTGCWRRSRSAPARATAISSQTTAAVARAGNPATRRATASGGFPRTSDSRSPRCCRTRRCESHRIGPASRSTF